MSLNNIIVYELKEILTKQYDYIQTLSKIYIKILDGETKELIIKDITFAINTIETDQKKLENVIQHFQEKK